MMHLKTRMKKLKRSIQVIKKCGHQFSHNHIKKEEELLILLKIFLHFYNKAP